MNKILFFLIFICCTLQTTAQSVVINLAQGWQESIFVQWAPVTNASSYNVYYTGTGLSNVKIDSQLIRSYGTYMRADVLGLAPGSYTVRVAPVVSGVEVTGTTSASLMVTAQDRTGFSFSNSRVPGGYKANGTLKDNAVVLYVTQNTKNSISVNVTGATTNPCVGLQNILNGLKKGQETRPFVIRLVGNITDPAVLEGGDIAIENAKNTSSFITFEGVGNDAVANGWGIRIKNATNIEIRNLGFMLTNASEGDNVSLQQNNDYVLVHNCDLFYGSAGGDADQAKGDGAMDCKKSTYVTFSYNHFWDSGKSNLLGLSEGTTSGLYITYHHNWYDHSDSRHPRVRFYSAHVYNNYYDGNSKYGAGSTLGSSVFMESNFFRNCKYPMLTSMQGSDIFGGLEGTFSGEAGGTIKAFNNVMSGQTRFVAYDQATNPREFDAIVVSSRSQTISSTITSKLGSNSYNNFDTNTSIMYSYTADSPEVARTKTIQFAGRVAGGDFKWTFNNSVDDIADAVNAPLMAALRAYTSKLVSVQGESSPPVTTNTQTLIVSSNANQTVVSGNAIVPIVFTWGGLATDVNVANLPVGLTTVKNTTAKTVTISGVPTGSRTFTVSTLGSSGSSVTITSTVNVTTSTSPTTGTIVHNFTTSGKTSSFYTITGNLNSTPGLVSYAGLTLTGRLKMESSTAITFTTSAAANVTLVFDTNFSGAVLVNNVSRTAVAGIVTVLLPAGVNTISKGSTAQLYYIATSYGASLRLAEKTLSDNVISNTIITYPNPVVDILTIESSQDVLRLEVYDINGVLVKEVSNSKIIDMSTCSVGTYFVKISTNTGSTNKIIIKKG
jgi:pectate lyase